MAENSDMSVTQLPWGASFLFQSCHWQLCCIAFLREPLAHLQPCVLLRTSAGKGWQPSWYCAPCITAEDY